ncbi:MAG: hypothetical protein AABX10_05015 [Nanoarchaeota archaeon]
MTESQSRYSIVERLTQKKLDLLSEGSELEEEVKKKKQIIDSLKKDLEEWESDLEQDIEKKKRIKNREIEKAEISSNNAVERKVAKMEDIKDKIKAIDKALERIEEISKNSPTN